MAGPVLPQPVPQPLQFVDIDGNRFAAFPNENKSRSLSEHVIEYLKTSNGAFRSLQIFERVAKGASHILREMGNAMSLFFDDVASKCGLAWAMLTIPRIPDVTEKAWKALSGPNPEPGPIANTNRGILQKIHDIADAMAAWGYGLSLILSNPAFKNAADVPNLLGDLTDLSMASTDYSLARKHLDYINANAAQNSALQDRFIDTMREALLRIVKAVASVVSGALGLLVLAFGGPVIPGAALLAIGLVATTASMSAHFFSETRNYDKVKFFEPRKNPVLINGVLAF